MPKRDEYMEAFKNGDDGYTGTIERISIEDSEGEKGAKARVTVRHGVKPKPSKSPQVGGSYPPSSEICLSPDEAEDLHVGQKVRVRIESV